MSAAIRALLYGPPCFLAAPTFAEVPTSFLTRPAVTRRKAFLATSGSCVAVTTSQWSVFKKIAQSNLKYQTLTYIVK